MREDALFMGRYPARTRERLGLRALVAERQEGKTTQLVEWLLGGEPIEAWPSWNRLLVVVNEQRYAYVLDRFGAASRKLEEKGCAGGLGKVVVSANFDKFVIQRMRLADVEVAVDDAEELIAQQLGFLPDVVSMTAKSFGSDAAHAPFKDAKNVLHLWYPLDRTWGHVGRKIGPCENQECADFGRDAARHRLEEG
jgi:hypothetical protein